MSGSDVGGAAALAAPAADPFETVRPAYGRASLADLLPSVLAVLGVPGATDRLGLAAPLAGVRRIAVLLVDGLGHFQLPAAAPYAPNLAGLAGEGVGARTLTAGFPSTTPTSLVTLGTGAAPGAHGVLGFTVNVPGTTRVLNHVEWSDDPDPYAWQPVTTQFDRAAAAGVAVSVVSRAEFRGSGLSVSAYRGAVYRPVADVESSGGHILAALTDPAATALVYGYLPEVDKAGHLFGVDSAEWRAAVSLVDRLVGRVADGLPADAALLVTADHGQLDVPADCRIDVDADPVLRAGVRVLAGEPRVRYLHTVPGATADVVAAWRAVLGAAAWVTTRDEAVADGWFGPMAEEHLGRVGDVVVACHDRYALLAPSTEKKIVADLVAYHGSYTAIEMTVPLLIARPPRI